MSTIKFEIESSCYHTYPCQHYVKINGERKSMSGTEIYTFCIENDLPIDEHFQQYKFMVDLYKYRELIKTDQFDSFVGNYLLDYNQRVFDHIPNCEFLIYACVYNNNIRFITYLVEEKKAPIIYQTLCVCTQSVNQLELFKYLLQKSQLDVTATCTNYLFGRANNLLSFASCHDNL